MLCRLVCLALGLSFSTLALAAQITKVSGSSALIELQGEPAMVGDTYFALDASGKKKAILKISKLKGDKAIAKIGKGKVESGMTSQKRAGGSSGSSGSGTSTASSGGGASTSRAFIGGMLGFAMDSMTAAVNNRTTNAKIGDADMKGNGFSGKAMFDYEVFDQIWFRGMAGVEQFSVAGSLNTNNTAAFCTSCSVNITYLSFDFIGRYVFSKSTFRPWVGFGVSLLFPATKESNALNSSSIGTTNVLAPQGGFDYFISRNSYIPVSIEYGILPKSATVDASWIAIRAGYAFSF